MQLSGSITALATPFTAAGEPDFEAWSRLIDHQLEAGTAGIVVAGSTGEAAALTDAELDHLAASGVRGSKPDQRAKLTATNRANTTATAASGTPSQGQIARRRGGATGAPSG